MCGCAEIKQYEDTTVSVVNIYDSWHEKPYLRD